MRASQAGAQLSTADAAVYITQSAVYHSTTYSYCTQQISLRPLQQIQIMCALLQEMQPTRATLIPTLMLRGEQERRRHR